VLWVPVTIGAAVSQLLRNALQSQLTGTIGTLGATLVRFLYALPFALAAYAAAVWGLGETPPGFSAPLALWAVLGALAQIGGTALMLRAMHLRGFAVAYAYIKTEPVLLALGGWWILGDILPALAWAGIMIATLGVVWAALPQGRGLTALRGESAPILLGIAGGALFGLSGLAFRAAILELGEVKPWLAALHVMCFTVLVQTAVLVAWLWFTERSALGATLRAWRPSLAAGLAGMVATLLWFTGFALTAAANVRTLALVEMPLAALINRRVSGAHLKGREWAGIAMVVLGIALLVAGVAQS